MTIESPNGRVTYYSIALHVTHFDVYSLSTLTRIIYLLLLLMLGSWIFDSTDVVLHLKLHFRSPTQTTILLPPSRQIIMTAIAVYRQTLLVRCYSVCTSH
jgi:hypothetical protein